MDKLGFEQPVDGLGQGFLVHDPLALLGSALYAALVHQFAIYAPRFLPTLGRPYQAPLNNS